MKQCLLLLCLLCSGMAMAQTHELELKSTILGYRVTQDGERRNWNDLLDITSSQKEAYDLIQKARTENTVTNALALTSGALIGWSVGASLHDQKNWTPAYIGGGLFIAAIPFAINTFNHLNKGVNTYNRTLKVSSRYQFRPQFQLVANGNGMGISMDF